MFSVTAPYLGSPFCLFLDLFLQHLEDCHNYLGCIVPDEPRKGCTRLDDALHCASGPICVGNGGYQFPCPWLVYECWGDFHDS